MPEPKGPPAKPAGKAPKTGATGGKAVGGIKGGLTRKVGPLPVWGWAAVAGGAFVVWTFLRGGSSGGDQGAYGVAGLDSLAGGGGGGGGGGYGGSGSGGGAGTIPGTDTGVPTLPDLPTTLPTVPTIPTVETAPYTGATPTPIAGLILPDNLDPTSSEFKAFFNIPENIQTVGELTYPAGITDAQRAAADASNMSLVDWYKYQITKVQAAASGLVLGEGAEFTARTSPEDYYRDTLQSGNIRMFAPGDPRDAAALTQALSELGLSSMPTLSSGSSPSISYQPIGNITPIAAPSTAAAPVDYSKAISTLQGYIANLNTGTVTQADRDKIATYQARIADYSTR